MENSNPEKTTRTQTCPPGHDGCSNPARCDCECLICKRAWEAAGRPSPNAVKPMN